MKFNTTPMDLLTRLATQQAQIGILGLGYVGLPLMLRYAEVGYPVLGFDIDSAKVEQLNAGHSYIEHIPAAAIAGARARGFSATTDFSRARDCDALILCVPTPLNPCSSSTKPSSGSTTSPPATRTTWIRSKPGSPPPNGQALTSSRATTATPTTAAAPAPASPASSTKPPSAPCRAPSQTR